MRSDRAGYQQADPAATPGRLQPLAVSSALLRCAVIAPVPARRLLIVAYTFPPMPSVGSNRWDAMARHLRKLGHSVTIVTTGAFGPIPDSRQERDVRRAQDLVASPLVRRLFRRGPLPPPSHASSTQTSATPPSGPLPVALQRILVPDLYLATWVPQAARLARRVAREEKIECVITSSPYESTHLVGFGLRRDGAAWMADFRDGWCFEPHRPPFPAHIQRVLDERMEARVARRADCVVAATRAIADDFARRLGVEAGYVPNGYDPLRHGNLPRVDIPGLEEDAIVLLHTGKLSGIRGRDPRPLFAAIRKLGAERPGFGERLRLVLAGEMDSADERLVAESGLGAQIVALGHCSHAESISLQHRADALVLLTSPNVSEVTGKLCEYLSAGPPILALAEGNEAARIVQETGAGITVRRDDPEAIAHAIRLVAKADNGLARRAEQIERYVYPGPAEAVEELVEEAISRRSVA